MVFQTVFFRATQIETGIIKNRICNLTSVACRHTQPMVSVCTGQSEKRFSGVKSAHAVASFAAGGEFADVIVRVVLAAEKIAVERQDNFRLVEMEHGLHGLAERLRRSALVV